MRILGKMTIVFLTQVLTNCTNPSIGQSIFDNQFYKIKHALQVKYVDKASSATLGQYKSDSSKYFTQLLLLPGPWSIDKINKELQFEGFVWIVQGLSPSQTDTSALENFEVFTATPVNGELENKKIVATNCHREIGQDNWFSIKIRIRESDRLYITNCSNNLLQEWEIGSLLK
jgi:hypothetical protein